MWKQAAFVFLATVCTAVAARAADVVVPHIGRLVTMDGTNEVPVSGTRKLKFALYSKSIDAEGDNNLVWEETYPGVEVHNGIYRVELGSTSGGRAPLDLEDLHEAASLWLEITVYANDGDAAGVKLSPRLRLAPSFGAHYALDAAKVGGKGPEAFVERTEFEAFRTEITGGQGSLRIPWDKVSGVPAELADGDDGLRLVAVGGTAIGGDGTGADPLVIKQGGIDSGHLKNGAVTAEKLAPGAVTPEVFQNGSVSPEKLQSCAEGQILKFQSGKWQCGVDTGSGGTLTFNVLAPLEQIPGSNGGAATVAVKDGGIDTVKLADDAVSAAKLKAEAGSLAKITGNAVASTATGAVGVGIGAPTARLEVADFDAAGVTGTGTVANYTANSTTVAISGGSFNGQVRVGDVVRIGNFDWRTVVGVAANGASLSVNAGWDSAYNGAWSYRRATLRAGQLTQTALGNVGIGTATPAAKLQVAGSMVLDGFQLFSGSHTNDQQKYLEVLNSPAHPTAAGVKTGWLLVSDSYAYANPGRNDAVIKGTLRVDGDIQSNLFMARAMCGALNIHFDYGTALPAPATQNCSAFCAASGQGRPTCVAGILSNGDTAQYSCSYVPGANYTNQTYCCCR